MNKVLQTQENALNSFSEEIQPGRPVGLYLYLNGVNATGVTSALTDLGTLTVKRGGRTIINRTLNSLDILGNIRFGKNYFSSTEADAFQATIFIPFYEEGLNQSLNITGANELVVSYDPKPAGVANFDSLNMTVYTAEGYETLPELYEYYILGDDQSISGAVNKPYQLNDDNISAVYVEDPDDVIANLAFKNINGQIFSAQPWEVLLGSTLIENRLEQSTLDMIEMQLFSAGEAPSYLNQKNIIEIETDGAGTVRLTKCFLIPNENFANLFL